MHGTRSPRRAAVHAQSDVPHPPPAPPIDLPDPDAPPPIEEPPDVIPVPTDPPSPPMQMHMPMLGQ